MEKRIRFSIWYFLASLAVLIGIQTYLLREPVSEITYAQFKQLLDAEKISDVVVGPTEVSGTFTRTDLEGVLRPEQLAELKRVPNEPHYFRAVRVEDPNLVGALALAPQDSSWRY